MARAKTSIIPIVTIKVSTLQGKYFYQGIKKKKINEGRIGYDKASYIMGLCYANYKRNKNNPINGWLLCRIEDEIRRAHSLIKDVDKQLEARKKTSALMVLKRIKEPATSVFDVAIQSRYQQKAVELLVDFDQALVKINGYHLIGIVSDDDVTRYRSAIIRAMNRYLGFVARIKFKTGDELEKFWKEVLPLTVKEMRDWFKSKRESDSKKSKLFKELFTKRFNAFPGEEFINDEGVLRRWPEWMKNEKDKSEVLAELDGEQQHQEKKKMRIKDQ